MSEDKKGFEPQYDDYKTNDRLYVGKENSDSLGFNYRKLELFLEQNTDFLSEKNADNNAPVSFNIKDEVILHSTDSGQQKIHCWLMESKDSKAINALHISRRTGKGVYGSQEVTLTADSIWKLKSLLNNIHNLDTSNKHSFNLPISDLQPEINNEFSRIINDEEFNMLIKANIKNTDDFYKLISLQKMELAINRLENIISGEYKNEIEIQEFLKENLWMFGNDYAFIIENGKINASNILDLIPKNIESYVDIIEVKLPNEKLFNYDNSHNNYYTTSSLTKAIAQTQNYIFELENMTSDTQYQTNNDCKIIRPKGIILFGAEEELQEYEKQYLRVLNSSYHNIQIITYQQLLDKAKNTLKTIVWNKNRVFIILW